VLLAAAVAGSPAHTEAAVGSQDPPVQPAPTQPADPEPLAAPPFRGLFGAGSPAAAGGHALDLTAFVYQEYGNTEDYLNPDLTDVLGTGWFMAARGALSYEHAGRYSRFGLRGEGAFRYYRETGQTTAPRFRFDMGVDSRFGRRRRDTVRVSGFVERQPYYVLPIFPSTVTVTGGTSILPPNRDDLLFRRDRYIYGQSLGLEHQFSARSYVTVDEVVRYTQADTPGLDVHSFIVGGRYGYRLSPNTSLRVGYAYQTGRYGAGTNERLESHDVDLGLYVQKPITHSRRTTLSLSAASSRVDAGGNQGWKVLGAAGLRHEFTKGWFVEGTFARDVQLVEGFAQPFFVNTVMANVGGFLSRRVELLASGGYSEGAIGFSDDRYDTLQGSARLRIALAKFLAIDAEGLTNQYTFTDRLVMPTGVPADLNRWAVRWSVSLWLPLSR
jgi:hypothetical protein